MYKLRELNGDEGSITLEATIVFPFFLLFLAFFIGFVRLASIQMTLDLAVGEATKEIATHYYPVSLVQNKIDDKVSGVIDGARNQPSVQEAESAYDKFPGKDVVDNYVNNQIAKAKDELSELVNSKSSPAVTEFVMQFQQGQLNKEQLSAELNIAQLAVKEEEDITIEASYDVKIPSPLGQLTIPLKSTAVEKAWK